MVTNRWVLQTAENLLRSGVTARIEKFCGGQHITVIICAGLFQGQRFSGFWRHMDWLADARVSEKQSPY
jgi:hypothetical protein